MAGGKRAQFKCMRCGYEYEAPDDPVAERQCPQCRSNSVRKLGKRRKGKKQR